MLSSPLLIFTVCFLVFVLSLACSLSSPTQQRDAMDQKLAEEMTQVMLKIGKLEIESVLRAVCDTLLRNPALDKQTKNKRAEALKIMGRMFKTAK